MKTKARWRKLGGGVFRTVDGHRINAGEVFRANEDEIPTAFRSSFQLVNEEDEKQPKEEKLSTHKVEKKPEPEKPAKVEQTVSEPEEEKHQEYQKVQTSLGWFDVIDSEGKPINEKRLRNQAADELLASL